MSVGHTHKTRWHIISAEGKNWACCQCDRGRYRQTDRHIFYWQKRKVITDLFVIEMKVEVHGKNKIGALKSLADDGYCSNAAVINFGGNPSGRWSWPKLAFYPMEIHWGSTVYNNILLTLHASYYRCCQYIPTCLFSVTLSETMVCHEHNNILYFQKFWCCHIINKAS